MGVLPNPTEKRGWQRSCVTTDVLLVWTGHCKRSGLKEEQQRALQLVEKLHKFNIKCSFSFPKIDKKQRCEVIFHI